MREWDIADPEGRKQTFEPRVAEMFAVKGRHSTQYYTALYADPRWFEGVNVCDYCAFGTKVVPNRAALCSFVHVACKPDEREDEKQVFFKIW